MIDPHASPEVEGILRYMAEHTTVDYRVSSTYRPGSTTTAGNVSRHARKLAVDLVAPAPSVDSPALAAIFEALVPVERFLAELIYAGPQVSYNVKYGKRVGKYAMAIHHNHVHVAVDPGVILDQVDQRPKSPVGQIHPAPSEEDQEAMSEPVGALHARGMSEGSVWVLTKDGGIRAYGDAPFYGSVPALKPENRTSDVTFVGLEPDARGYTVVGASGARYTFNPDSLDMIQRGEI